MAKYIITTDVAGETVATVERKQKPAAFQAFQNATRDTVRNRGGLDTRWGVRAMAQTEGASEDVSRFTVTVQDAHITLERVA